MSKRTIVITVLLVAAGAYVIVDKLVSRNRDEVETTDTKGRLFEVKDRNDVTSLTIRPADGSEIRISGFDARPP